MGKPPTIQDLAAKAASEELVQASESDGKYICDRCGAEMSEHNCKIVCSNCGHRFDCSDLNIYFD